jgi:hypothetical protein
MKVPLLRAFYVLLIIKALTRLSFFGHNNLMVDNGPWCKCPPVRHQHFYIQRSFVESEKIHFYPEQDETDQSKRRPETVG